MRKLFLSVIMILFINSCVYADLVNQNNEIHEIIGSLYSIVCAVKINDNSINTNTIKKSFSDIPNDWLSRINIIKQNNSIWAGISINKYSSARQFLRDNAKSLNITESPEGYSWFGGEQVWLNISALTKINAAKGSGNDSNIIFLSVDNGNSWWQAIPSFKSNTAENILSRFGINNPPELHKPSGKKQTIYESVKPDDVKKPDDIHLSRKKSSFDIEMDLGNDIIFKPVPNVRY